MIPDATDPSAPVPAELAARPPRPLPRWARRRTYPVLVLAFSATCLLAAAYVYPLRHVASVAPTVIGLAFAAMGWDLLATRRLLARADGVAVGRVKDAWEQRGWLVTYEFPTPAGTRTGSAVFQSWLLVDHFGFRPGAGDTVFVVYDTRDPSRNTAWGFALPPGARREPAWLDRPMPRWLLVSLVAATVVTGLLAASAIVKAMLR